MNFGLLLSKLPHVAESRAHYDAMLSLDPRQPMLMHWLRWLKIGMRRGR
ncbi:hypothetical protein [Burkholderia plantarii]|nr:hypothetical protein [Burkholderia plantarii]MBI0331316.1 hypothetical protein [Burkholderia plantarii]